MRNLLMLSSLLVVLFLSGCATTAIIGGKPLPTPSTGFVPAEKLSYSKNKVYTAIQQVLIEENIGVVNENKEMGRITTDYLEGPVQNVSHSGIFKIANMNIRYKYLITAVGEGKNTSTLKVKASLESSSSTMHAWRDVTSENPENTTNLERFLIEKIEKKLAAK